MSIDDVLLNYNIRTMDQIIHVLSAVDGPSRHTALKSPLDGRASQSESAGRDVTGAAIGLPAPSFMTLSNGERVDYDLFQVSFLCWSAKDSNNDRRCGWGSSKLLAIRDLRALCEDEIGEKP